MFRTMSEQSILNALTQRIVVVRHEVVDGPDGDGFAKEMVKDWCPEVAMGTKHPTQYTTDVHESNEECV